MALTSDQITAQNFADFYQMILPYLNGGQSVSDVTYTANTANLKKVNFRRCGNVVTMNFVSKAISANTNTEILTLDSDFRPINDIIGVCNSGDVAKFGQVMIDALTGKVTIYSSVATGGYYGHLTFVIK